MFKIKQIACLSIFHPKFLLPRLIFQASRPFSLIALLNLQEKLETTKIPCSSCGFNLQIKDSFQSGYIDSKILLKHEETSKPEENDSNKKPIYCERCHAIKANKTEIPGVVEEKKLQEYSLSEFIKEIYSEIKPYSLVIYLIDLANFQATIIPEVLRMKSLKTCKIWLIVNKIDVLPVDFELPKAKSYIRRHFKGLELPIDDVLFLSSKTGVGFDRMLSKLNPLQEKGQYRTVYIIGCTNTGKSTFINMLLRKLKPHSSENKHPRIEDAEIPTSQLPNTTLKTMIKEVPGLKYRFFDTPGIPNEVVLGREMSGLLKRNRNLVIAKKIKPERVDLSNGSSMFIGGLARIDYPVTSDGEATRVIFHLYCAYNVSLHRTSMEKANEIYLKHYNGLLAPVFDPDITKTVFKRHEITINFARNGESLEFLEIFGLGWLRFSKLTTNSQKTVKINLFLPETVYFGLRESMRSAEDPHNRQSKFRDLRRRKKEKNQRISRKILNNNPLKNP